MLKRHGTSHALLRDAPRSMRFSHALLVAPISRSSPSIPCILYSPSQLDHAASYVHDLILRSRSLPEAKQAHGQAAVRGLLRRHLPTAAALLLAYSTHRDLPSSRRLFEESPLREGAAFLWNALSRALSTAGLPTDALAVYNRMLRRGIRPDDRTFPFALTAAAAVPQKGRELHGSVVKLGFEADLFVGNCLLSFYGAIMALCDAQQMFDEMRHRDIVSWNSIISLSSANGLRSDAMYWFLDLKRSGLAVNAVTLVSVLPACAAAQDEIFGKGIHGHAIKVGLDSVVTVGNAFVDMYGKCGNSKDSMQAFHIMPEKNNVSWNSIIGSFVHVGLFEDALWMFREMVVNKMKPNSVTIASLLPALVELGSFWSGREVHGYSVRTGMDSDVFVSNSLVDMYAKSGYLKKGSNIFYSMEDRNVVSWNAMIANLAQNGAELEAIALVREMQVGGEFPNSVTFTNVLPACTRMASLRKGKEIHARSIRVGSSSDLFMSNALIDMYAKCGRLKLARNVFDVSERDEVSYNTLIVGYSQTSGCSEAVHLFLEMRFAGFEYDVVSFMGVLSACANLSALKQGKEVHCLTVRKLFDNHLFVANSLLDLYIKCGRINLARKIFDRMLNKDVASWNSMILGYGMQGELETAIETFDLMKDEGMEYDHVSYIAVLSACSHAGLVKRGKKYFDQMIAQNISATHMHYACMVDLLGRAGLVEEAVELIRGMPFEADSNVWGALLGACRIHGNIELGRWAAEHLFKLKPGHCGYYILLSNMYAEAGRWDEANEIRELMKSRKAKKNPGCSWIVIGDKLRAFIAGERIEGPEEELCYAGPG
ncbi:pentatricopeptide repeat-containing protein At4g14170-like [Phoenix dactylifera]|uniref:Pentatricopeptide repeat-containing protein At4g14170-like n=1 Tax=Phoenix dactylifera TaxID=42345 RepID=A0A8B8ZPL5_PHODC|nr:pentatricopeptide repeat-containing protein At4g14170-like [Phoenix dactylifera]